VDVDYAGDDAEVISSRRCPEDHGRRSIRSCCRRHDTLEDAVRATRLLALSAVLLRLYGPRADTFRKLVDGVGGT
jgi:hypothetical protein